MLRTLALHRWGPKFASPSFHLGFVVDKSGCQIFLGDSPIFHCHKCHSTNFTTLTSTISFISFHPPLCCCNRLRQPVTCIALTLSSKYYYCRYHAHVCVLSYCMDNPLYVPCYFTSRLSLVFQMCGGHLCLDIVIELMTRDRILKGKMFIKKGYILPRK